MCTQSNCILVELVLGFGIFVLVGAEGGCDLLSVFGFLLRTSNTVVFPDQSVVSAIGNPNWS